ncbi:MAG TPA: 50S ribosomal protein L11 methyltransferase [Anaerolineales bacterium]|jgi:ribosomal protein L11 methyltransferase
MPNWLEVSLAVDGELAEAVADVLARFAPNGVAVESTAIRFLGDEDEGTASGPMIVRAYLPVDESLEETRQRLEQALYFLGMIQPLPSAVYTEIADQNWMEAWKQYYRPIPIGRRLMIVPAWLDSPDPGRIPIKIDPGMAFGTGTHPTTQLSLELMESCFDGGRSTKGYQPSSSTVQCPSSAIDVGCGSGILSIAALKLGAARALAVDIDAEAIRNSRQNADTNGVGTALILGQGSVSEILAGEFPLKSAPLVMANILAPVILRLFDAGLTELVDPGGTLILSGILADQEEAVKPSAQARGLKLSEQKQSGDWVALAFKRRP